MAVSNAARPARKRLTARAIETLKPAPPASGGKRDGRRFVMDAEVSGFGVKVTETGTRSYVLIKRFPGFKHPAPRELGKCDALTLDEAREKARRWNGMIAKGLDPSAVEASERAIGARQRANTASAVFEDFAKEKLAGERQGRDVERDMRKEFLPVLGGLGIHEVSDEDILKVIRIVKTRAPAHARNLLGYARRFFDWAIDQRVYGIKVNPCIALRPKKIIGAKVTRNRVLTDDEVFALWRASAQLAYPFGPLYRLLILTGLRLNEVADARWSEFDSRNRVWVVPAARMKGKRDHVVPVTDEIYAVLKSLPEFKAGDHLFSTTFGSTPVWVSDKAKRRLDRRMLKTLKALARRRGEDPKKVELAYVNHDLRRTLRTGLSRLRIDRDIREAVLAHARPGIEGVYDRYDYLDEKRDALERWADSIWQLTHPLATNVVEFPATYAHAK